MDSGGYKPLGGVDDQQDQKNIGGKGAIYEERAKNCHHMCAVGIKVGRQLQEEDETQKVEHKSNKLAHVPQSVLIRRQ